MCKKYLKTGLLEVDVIENPFTHLISGYIFFIFVLVKNSVFQSAS